MVMEVMIEYVNKRTTSFLPSFLLAWQGQRAHIKRRGCRLMMNQLENESIPFPKLGK